MLVRVSHLVATWQERTGLTPGVSTFRGSGPELKDARGQLSDDDHERVRREMDSSPRLRLKSDLIEQFIERLQGHSTAEEFFEIARVGRFTALAAATPVLEKPTSRDFVPRDVSTVSVIGQASPSRVRRLTRRTLPDEDRYLRLREVGIHRPAGPLRSEAIARAALVQAHTRVLDEIADAKATRVVARYLYDEAIVFGEVDEERALTRPAVDQWLSVTMFLVAGRSALIARFFMPQAGRCIQTNFLSHIVNADRDAKRFRPQVFHWRLNCTPSLRTCVQFCGRSC